MVRILWAGLVVLVCVSMAGGSFVRFSSYRAVDEKNPVVLFDRYKVVITGGVIDSSLIVNLVCEVYFDKDISAKVPLDTIPVFIIDSVYLRGACLDRCVCLVPREAGKLRQVFEDNGERPPNEREVLRADLGVGERNMLRPAWFNFPGCNVRLPYASLSQTMETVIYASLLDRRTGAVIGRTFRKVPSIVKRYKRINMLS